MRPFAAVFGWIVDAAHHTANSLKAYALQLYATTLAAQVKHTAMATHPTREIMPVPNGNGLNQAGVPQML
ncbi:hypothetical protein SAMD00023353_8700140 [Rosellinia necatrix]|uniref:Uncharacterized protein n=1 Tax=Rosellinia necatrix TaxID=77044 RepID=A0A1S8ABC4_ROSNE|nr:hypothetical protein SAMD00023353_8700140 [Rosellinia necatrix]